MVSATPTHLRRAAALGATVLLSSGGLAATAAATPVERSSELPTVEAAPFPDVTHQQLMASYVNSYRAARGIPALRTHSALQTAAQRHADDMARRNRMTHTGSNGSNAGQRITAAGFRWTAWAENIAVGYPTAKQTAIAWFNSSGHRTNMLNRAFTYLGVGVTYRHGRHWWCLVLARG